MKEKNNFGLVSIIMPAHNSQEFIEDSIKSVLNQDYSNWELFVILDNCSDDTENVVSIIKNNDSRIKIVKTTNNKYGAAGARNLGISLCKGKYIAFLDSDDLWTKDKLSTQISDMNKRNYNFSYGNYYVKKPNQKIVKFYANNKATYKSILRSCFIGCLTVIYDAEKLGKFYMPIEAKYREDFATWLNILKDKRTKCYNCGHFVGTYVMRKKSTSSSKMKMVKYQWNVYRKIENKNFLVSTYYLLTTIFYKMIKY